MKIKTDNWHFYIVNTYGTFPQNDLCRYVWQVIGLITMLFAVGMMIGISLLVASLPIFCALYIWITGIPWIWHETFPTLAIIAAVFEIVGLLWCGLYYWFKYWKAKQLDKEPGTYKPNIFFEYLRAKKQKICPILEFEDDE
jgi:hypothetical protein